MIAGQRILVGLPYPILPVDSDGELELVTRRYPVDLPRMNDMLRKDLQGDFPFVIHLGQCPGSTTVQLEDVGLNINSDGSKLIKEAPEVYRTVLPIDRCSEQLIKAGIPARSPIMQEPIYAMQFISSRSTTPILLECEQRAYSLVSLTPAQAAKASDHPPA